MRVDDVGDELRAALAIARKELQVELRYPLSAINGILQPLYQFLIPSLLLGATFLVGGRAIGFERSTGTDDLAGFLFVGMLIGALAGAAFWGVGYSFKREMDGGTLESSWLTPTRPATFVVGRAIGYFAMAAVTGAILLAMGAVVFGAEVALGVVSVLPVLALSGVGLLGVGYLVAAVVLRVKEPNLVVDATDFLFAIGSGVAFPVLLLPEPMRLVALALPTTYGLDLMRVGALGTEPLVAAPIAWAALAGLSLAWLIVGRWAFERTEHTLRVRGTLGEH